MTGNPQYSGCVCICVSVSFRILPVFKGNNVAQTLFLVLILKQFRKYSSCGFQGILMYLQPEREEIQVVILLAQEVAQDSGWVTTADLVSRQKQVETLHHVPDLWWPLGIELPGKRNKKLAKIMRCDC